MIDKMFSLLGSLKTQMQGKTFWFVVTLSMSVGCFIGYQVDNFLMVRYKEPKWESERQALETRIASSESHANEILKEKEQVVKQLEDMKGKLNKCGEVDNSKESLVISNQTLLAIVQNTQNKTDVLNAQIESVKNSLTILREKYSAIPENCTNTSLISVAYDLDEKIKLRDGAIERQTDELKAIMVDILAGLQKESQVQATRIKLLPLGTRQKEEVDFAVQFTTSVTLIGVFYGHFIKHIYQHNY